MGSVAGVDVLAGEETVVASWAALAALSPGAELVRTDDAVAAVFPAWAALNNAIVLGPATRGHAQRVASAVAGVFAAAQVPVWSLWLPGTARDFDAADEITGLHPLSRDTTTLVMRTDLHDGLRLDDRVVRTSIESSSRASDETVAAPELEPPDESRATGLDGWVLVHDGLAVAGAWTYRHGADCGVYAVGTVPGFRRRGHALALVEHVMAESRGRGATTASLQSTAMGQPLYARLGFRAVGRYEEWVHATA